MYEVYSILTGVMFAVGIMVVLIFSLRNEVNDTDYTGYYDEMEDDNTYDWWN